MRILVFLVSLALTMGCTGSEPRETDGVSEAVQRAGLERGSGDESLVFDSAVDDELADFVLDREAELSDVQERGANLRRSRSRVIEPGPQRRATSARRFRKQTDRAGLQTAVAHVEAVRRGTAQPNVRLVATAVAEASAAAPDQDVTKLAFMAFRTSIQQANADKRHALSRLQHYNEMAALLAEYLKRLTDALDRGGDCSDDDFDAREVDTSPLDADLRTRADRILENRAWVESSAGLERTLEEVRNIAEEVRSRREEADSAFQNFDQKANQLFNMLSTVLKAMNEMRMGTVRNML